MRVGLVYDLRAQYLAEGFAAETVAEFDSEETIDALENTLTALGHGVERIGHGRDLAQALARGARWDLVFNIAEGLGGRCREAQVPALLELYDQPYTFSDPLVCAVTLDKAVAKRLVASAGLPTPAFRTVFTPGDIESAAALAYPLFIKPLAEGTGKGVSADSRAATPAALRREAARLLAACPAGVLVEEYLPGREFTTGILGTGDSARVLGTMEIRIHPDAPSRDYTFTVKEECERWVVYDTPPDDDVRRAVEDVALRAHRALECRDASRIDVRLDRHGHAAFIECNPLPGLHPTHSDLPMIATRAGMDYRTLIGTVVAHAAGRCRPAAPQPRAA
jgi:D-alanine-D-alanine ligase